MSAPAGCGGADLGERKMLKTALAAIDRVVEGVVVLLFATMVLVGGIQVFNRFVLGSPLAWSEEVQKYAHIWLIFLAIPICYRRGRHIGMEIITARLPRPARIAMALAVDALWVFLGASIARYTWAMMEVAEWQYSPALEIRMDRVYMGELAGGLYLALNALRSMAEKLGSLRREPQSESRDGEGAAC